YRSWAGRGNPVRGPAAFVRRQVTWARWMSCARAWYRHIAVRVPTAYRSRSSRAITRRPRIVVPVRPRTARSAAPAATSTRLNVSRTSMRPMSSFATPASRMRAPTRSLALARITCAVGRAGEGQGRQGGDGAQVRQLSRADEDHRLGQPDERRELFARRQGRADHSVGPVLGHGNRTAAPDQGLPGVQGVED